MTNPMAAILAGAFDMTDVNKCFPTPAACYLSEYNGNKITSSTGAKGIEYDFSDMSYKFKFHLGTKDGYTFKWMIKCPNMEGGEDGFTTSNKFSLVQSPKCAVSFLTANDNSGPTSISYDYSYKQLVTA